VKSKVRHKVEWIKGLFLVLAGVACMIILLMFARNSKIGGEIEW